MPGPMSFTGIVTKVGRMNKTATVTVTRHVVHKVTGKVSVPQLKQLEACLTSLTPAFGTEEKVPNS
jgi:hypothetical protein